MNPSERNPLRESPGKGDKPRSCFSKKFRKNFDEIDWSKPKEVKKCDSQCEDKDNSPPSKISDTNRDGFNSKD